MLQVWRLCYDGVVQNFDAVKQRFSRISGVRNERTRRLLAAVEAEALGYGGVSLVARATGVSRRAITAGLAELKHGVLRGEPKSASRIRQAGRSAVRTPVDLPELAGTRRPTPYARPSSQSHLGRRIARRDGLQSASQSKDEGRNSAPGS